MEFSKDFMTYWFKGARKREQYLNEGVEDPIYTTKPFPSSGMTYSSASARRNPRRRG